MDGNGAIKTYHALCKFLHREMDNFFSSQTFFDHISLVFYYFELIFFLNDRCIYGQVRMGCFFGGMVSAAAATTVKKRVYIFRVININSSFGELNIFQKAQNVNNIQSISYILIVWRKKFEKRRRLQKPPFQKWKKISERYKLSAQATTLPFKNLTLGHWQEPVMSLLTG